MRRVVTGHISEGKATITSDMEVNPITIGPGWELFSLWGAQGTTEFPNDGSVPDVSGIRPDFHKPGSYVFGVFTIPPHSKEGGGPGFHTTNSIDFSYVSSGEVWLELDDGKEVLLRTGDTYIQNGTRHAWRNKGSVVCTVVACMVGAKRKTS
jgi:mannose-6-phosphate isomerase-like protein (cupin superfamily)